jgi:hypothetical protein
MPGRLVRSTPGMGKDQDSVKSPEFRAVTLLLPQWTLADTVVRKGGSHAVLWMPSLGRPDRPRPPGT